MGRGRFSGGRFNGGRFNGGRFSSSSGGATVPAMFGPADWSLTDSPSAGGNQLIADIINPPANGGSPLTALQFSVGGGAYQTLAGGVTAGPRAITVLAGALASVVVRAVNAVGNGPASAAKERTPSVSVARGFMPMQDEGTTGDIFVAKTGSDANPGTFALPKLTIAGGKAALLAGQHMKLRGGVYPEIVNFSGIGGTIGNPTRISRYGTEVVRVTAADAITGWTQCGAGDSTALGATLGVVSSPVYKKTVTKASIASGNPRAAFLFENGQHLNHVQARVPNPQYPDSEQAVGDWKTATTTVTSAGLVTGFRLASLTSLYTTAQIQNCDVGFHAQPNLGYRTKVLSFGVGTDAVADTINLTDQTQNYETNSNRNKFVLLNILPALKAGEWGFTDDDATNCTLYVYPINSANMTANIEVSARGKVFDLVAGLPSYCEIIGLVIDRASSYSTSATLDYAISAGNSVSTRTGFAIRNCHVLNNYRGGHDYAPIHIGKIDNSIISQTTVENAYGQVGIFVQGGEWNGTGMNNGLRIDHCLIKNSESTPVRLYGCTNSIVSFSTARGCGTSAHANKAANYASCHRNMYWGCDFRGNSGYWTFQEASSIVAAFCDIPVSYLGDDGYAINDQNSATALQQSPATEQGINGDSYILNCITEPFRDAISNTNSIALDQVAETQVRFGVKNNIFHGATTVNETLLITNGWRNNLMTSGAALAASAGTDTVAAHANVYNNVNAGDTSIKAGSPSLSAATASIAAELAVLAGWFPDFTSFNKDIAEVTFSSATPPMGPYVSALSPLPMDMLWIDQPAIAGTPTSGVALTLTGGYRVGYPWAAQTQQWIRSTNFVAVANISGQTASTYAPDVANGDVGYYIGCDVTSGGVTTRVWTALQVVAAAAFAARGAYFDGADYYNSTAISVAAASTGLMSFWFKLDDPTWNTPVRTLFGFAVGGVTVLSLTTASAGRLTFRLNNNTATDTATFYSAAGNVVFAPAIWYHLLISWTTTGAVIYVNNAQIATMTFATIDMDGSNLSRIGIGSSTAGGALWKGDIGHLWFSPTQTLDMTVLANREKFALATDPVDLGASGAIPTGTAPQWYYDGAGAAWNNQGTAGTVPLTGALVASGTAPSY